VVGQGEVDLPKSVLSSYGITDFGVMCEKCETINTITLEERELKKQP
jgi:hypothetical protein